MSLIYETNQKGILQSRSCLYLGGKADAKNKEWLERTGVSHILNVTPTKEVSVKVRDTLEIPQSRDFSKQT